MEISVDELKELMCREKKPNQAISVTIRVETDDQYKIVKPFYIEESKIDELGIFDINGIRYWIVKL